MSVYNIPPSCGDRNESRSTLRLPAATEMNEYRSTLRWRRASRATRQFPVLSSQFSVPGSQFSVLGSQFPVPGSRFSVLGSWFLVLGSQFSVLGSWFSVLGSRFLVLGSWFLVLGSRFLVLGSWNTITHQYCLQRWSPGYCRALAVDISMERSAAAVMLRRSWRHRRPTVVCWGLTVTRRRWRQRRRDWRHTVIG